MAMKMIVNMKMKMRKSSYRYDRNTLNMDKNILNMKFFWVWWCLICIKQHLSKIWSSNHEKVKQHWG